MLGPAPQGWELYAPRPAAGAFISMACFELEFFSGLAHAGLYLIATMALALISGVTLASGGG